MPRFRPYAEGTWTPVLTFATPGNLSVAYTTQSGFYVRDGNMVDIACNIVTSTFTHTSASGALQVTGLPFTSRNINNQIFWGSGQWRGVTKANFTDIAVRAAWNTATLDFVASGSAQTPALLASGDCPTGGTMNLLFSVRYLI